MRVSERVYKYHRKLAYIAVICLLIFTLVLFLVAFPTLWQWFAYYDTLPETRESIETEGHPLTDLDIVSTLAEVMPSIWMPRHAQSVSMLQKRSQFLPGADVILMFFDKNGKEISKQRLTLQGFDKIVWYGQ